MQKNQILWKVFKEHFSVCYQRGFRFYSYMQEKKKQTILNISLFSFHFNLQRHLFYPFPLEQILSCMDKISVSVFVFAEMKISLLHTTMCMLCVTIKLPRGCEENSPDLQSIIHKEKFNFCISQNNLRQFFFCTSRTRHKCC